MKILEAEDDFTCYEAQHLAVESWFVAMGEHSDATPDQVVEQMLIDMKPAPGLYHIKIRLEITEAAS